ncbi:MAG: glycosyltransferase [Gemmatimonadetes bacterium]|nr:glycosyltransferase [Gemmatimonadota bacterium]
MIAGERGPAPDGRILVHRVIARLNVGGPALHVVNLVRGLDEHGFRTRLIVGGLEREEGDMSWYARERGVHPTVLAAMARELRPARDFGVVLALRRLFSGDGPAIVHTHTAKAGALGRAAAAWAGVPVRIHTFHGHVLGGDYFSSARTRLFLEVERQLARASSRLIVLTRAQRRDMVERLEIADDSRFAVIPLGLELDRFRAVRPLEARGSARAALGIAPDERVVGIVGRLVPVKNHELMLDAFARLARSPGAPWRLVVVGGGEERERELRERSRRLGIEGRVLWLGWRQDLDKLYPAMDVAALTSHDEGTPVALLEALAAGVPVAARAVGGVAEVLEEGRLGILVEEDDAIEMAAAIERAVARPVDDATRDRVVARFSVRRLCADMAALYREELERAGAA